MPPVKPKPDILRSRLDAYLALRRSSLKMLSVKMQWTDGHLSQVFDGKRPGSAALFDALRAEVGEAAWQFITGQTNALVDEPASQAAA